MYIYIYKYIYIYINICIYICIYVYVYVYALDIARFPIQHDQHFQSFSYFPDLFHEP